MLSKYDKQERQQHLKKRSFANEKKETKKN